MLTTKTWKNAEEVWDDLTEQFTQRWGNGHEQTIKHYELVGCLLSVWDRHENSLNILCLLANLVLELREGNPDSTPRISN